jgi:phospho-N-acetylmuramoyl-pentapeptide-transferase
MALNLGLLIFSFVITSILIVPFINLLYKIKFRRLKQHTIDAFGKSTPIFDKFHTSKAGTPIGGGLLVIGVVTILFMILFPLLKRAGVYITQNHPIREELSIIFFTFLSFGLLGLYDDVMKFFRVEKSKFFGLRLRHKFVIQWALAFTVAAMMYWNLNLDIVNVPFFGVLDLGIWFVPFSAFVIVAFANAVNVTDGLDGLASGNLMITLFSLWLLSAAILDVPLSIFLALWIGSLIAFLYFNIYPARLFLGDVGALAFGATIAVIGLLVGKIFAVSVMGGIFVVELISSLMQLLSKKYRGKKIFPVAPLHLWLQLLGWEEPKIVMRAWLAAIMLAVIGLWLAIV